MEARRRRWGFLSGVVDNRAPFGHALEHWNNLREPATDERAATVDALTFLNLVVALAAVASAVFAFVQARSATDSRQDALDAGNEARKAQSKAETAQADARKIAAEARDALSRSAVALERANELSEAALPKAHVHWRISPTREDGGYIAINDGTIPAFDVVLSGEQGILIDEDSRGGSVSPGEGCEFTSWRGRGMGTPRIGISWNDSTSSLRQKVVIAVIPVDD